jgi:hypothetical protein
MVDDRITHTGRCTTQASGEEGFRSAVVCLVIDQARMSGQVESLEHVWPRFGITQNVAPSPSSSSSSSSQSSATIDTNA